MAKKYYKFRYLAEVWCALGGIKATAQLLGVSEFSVQLYTGKGLPVKHWDKIQEVLPGLTGDEIRKLKVGAIPIDMQMDVYKLFFGESYYEKMKRDYLGK